MKNKNSTHTMKKIITYIAALMLCTACSTEDIVEEMMQTNGTSDTPAVPEEKVTEEEEDNRFLLTVPYVDSSEGTTPSTRSILSYNTETKMHFSWENGDKISVYGLNVDNEDIAPGAASPMIFSLEARGQVNNLENSTSSTFEFETVDDGVSHLRAFCTYASYYPVHDEGDIDYDKIPVSYLGQVQEENVFMKEYYDWKYNPWGGKTTDEKAVAQATAKANYLNSEMTASAHLSDVDYMISDPANASPTGTGIHFFMKRLGAVARLYLYVPLDKYEVYDSIQIVNNNKSKPFIVKTKMNVKTQAFDDSDATTSNVISVKLGANGFDFTDANSTNRQKYFDARANYGYTIIAYIMVHPIDLSSTTLEKCKLYLIGRESQDPGANKVYYKASLSRKNLEADKLYQWSYEPSKETPITVTPISVQEFMDRFTDNGPEGTGTEGW